MRNLFAVPEKPETFGLYYLPEIHWDNMKIPKQLVPKEMHGVTPENYSLLPKADFVVITWTLAEWAALNHVFCGFQSKLEVEDISKKCEEPNKYGHKMEVWANDWIPYVDGFESIVPYLESLRTNKKTPPSLISMCWGYYKMVSVNGKSILLIKSNMHLSTDGSNFPLIQFVEKICKESQPKLLLTIGTAGAVIPETALGSVIISNQAVFDLRKDINRENPLNKKTVLSDWIPIEKYLKHAESIFFQVKGLPIYPISPQYPADEVIAPYEPDSKIYNKTPDPVITTDSFLYGTTTDRYGLVDQGCIVEMDDALVGYACNNNSVPFGIVRNASDPVMDGRLPEKMQGNWSGYIYEEVGLFTSYNGALTSWALIASETE